MNDLYYDYDLQDDGTGFLDVLDRLAEIGTRTYQQIEGGSGGIYRTRTGSVIGTGSMNLMPVLLIVGLFLILRK